MEHIFAVDIKSVSPSVERIPTFGSLVTIIVQNAFVLAGVISFILLIFGGFSIIVAGGDTKKLETGKNAITGAVIGLLVVVTSYWLVEILGMLTGIDLLKSKL